MPSAHQCGRAHPPSDITERNPVDDLLPDKAKETTNPGVSQSLWKTM